MPQRFLAYNSGKALVGAPITCDQELPFQYWDIPWNPKLSLSNDCLELASGRMGFDISALVRPTSTFCLCLQFEVRNASTFVAMRFARQGRSPPARVRGPRISIYIYSLLAIPCWAYWPILFVSAVQTQKCKHIREFRTCTFRHLTDQEVVPHTRKVHVP